MKQPSAPVELMKVSVPGKLILSGEHAVVYGQPAIAMAINRYVTATITREARQQILFDLADLAHQSHLSLDSLRYLKERIKRKYYRFIRGEYSIRQVLRKPFELAQVAMGLFAESLNMSLPHGVKIHIQSDIPVGCGMGSSAATILSVMQAVSHFLRAPIAPETLYKLALEAENMQHGQSSGLDLRVAMQGGCVYMHKGEIVSRPVPELPMYLVNTGTPAATTGECVEQAAEHFQSTELGDAFGDVTRAMDSALCSRDWQGMRIAIRENHRLLTRIGVVPEMVNQFIAEVEASGGAAKVCGAGAVRGDNAGVVLVVSDDVKAVESLCAKYHYPLEGISCESRGIYAV